MKNQANKKIKIAVLGGGMSAMSTIYELLKADNFGDKYEITVYQMGWRIGGKGASGRQHLPDDQQQGDGNQRITEHGLHAWFGWYTNAFNQFKDLYNHLNWPPTHPFATWRKAFTTEDHVVLMEKIGNQWKEWDLEVPSLPMVPGGETELLPVDEYIRIAFRRVRNHLWNIHKVHRKPQPHRGIFSRILHFIARIVFWLFGKILYLTVIRVVNKIEKILLRKNTETIYPGQKHHGEVITLIERLLKWIYREVGLFLSMSWTLKKFFILFDFGLTFIKGMIKDNVIAQGLNSINNVDFKEWLHKHGATDITVNSVLVRTVYDGCFAYLRGNKNSPNLEAGVAIRYCVGIGLGSKEHFLWKMNAGMGDTIFSPFYDVLRKNGVKFEFFHKVTDLKLSEDRKSVSQIILQRQVSLKPAFEQSGYQPTFKVGGVDCWPSEPFYDQLVEGEELKKLASEAKNVNLESFWSQWPGCRDESQRMITLNCSHEGEKGDFDKILLNIPIASHFHICPDLIAHNQRWYDMIENVATNQTISVQLWFNKSAQELGWDYEGKVMTGFTEPLDTYADMTHLLKAENWKGDVQPKNLVYLVSAFKEDPVSPPLQQHSFPAYTNSLGEKAAIEFLNKYMHFIYPQASGNENFRWELLFDPSGNKTGRAKMGAQYWVVNVDPSERYTLSVRGSSAYRLRADESGYENLFFAGDWTDNGLNIGCIEACVISGIRAAAAISGKKIPVAGDNGLYKMT